MSIVNRRNAVLGWATWLLGKRVLKKKVKAAKPAVEGHTPNAPAKVVAGAAAAIGSLVLLKRRRRRRGSASETDGLRDGE